MVPFSIQRWLAGDKKLGPFCLRKPLGEGNYAPVWLADLSIGAGEPLRAAVKLFAMGAPGSSAQEAVVAEARSLSKVQHPNVVQFFLPLIDEASGVIGLAMEYVAGQSLAAVLKAEPEGRLSHAMTIEIGIALASALDAVHRAGLIHQDVKPANVVVAAKVYKLIDFGIAAARVPAAERPGPAPGAGGRAAADDADDGAGENPPTRPVPGSWGTRGYVDPACEKGEPAGPASDLYALGVTLYQCLAGKVPSLVRVRPGWKEDTAILSGDKRAPRISEVAPGTPAKLAELVDELVHPSRQNRPRSAELVVIRLQQIKAEARGRTLSLPPEGPFRGLGRFEEGHRDVYFGRGPEVAGAIDTVRSHGLTALVGPSGSGKSSLARAGILPAIAEGALGGWPTAWEVAVAEPGADPRASIAAALARAVRSEKDGALQAAIQDIERSSTPDRLIDALAERARLADVGLLIFVDQLEQLDAVAPEKKESRQWLILLLARLSEYPLPGVRALVAIRHDRFDKILAFPEIGRAAGRGMVQVEPMTTAVWRDVISQAISAYRYAFEDARLLDDIVRGIEPIADKMTLVQFALTEIWRRCDHDKKRVTRAAFGLEGQNRSVGIEGALDRYADSVLKRAMEHPGVGEGAAQKFFVALTRPDETREARTREQLVAEAARAADPLIACFADAGLLESAPDGGYALAHDTLIRSWKRLHGWVDEIREDRRLAQKLDEDARARQEDANNTSLWIGERLSRGEDLRKLGKVPLTAAAVAFLEESRRAVDDAVASQRAQEARQRALEAQARLADEQAQRAAEQAQRAAEQAQRAAEQAQREREEKELEVEKAKIAGEKALLANEKAQRAADKAKRERRFWLLVMGTVMALGVAVGAGVYARSRAAHAEELAITNDKLASEKAKLAAKNDELAANEEALAFTLEERDLTIDELAATNQELADQKAKLADTNKKLEDEKQKVLRQKKATEAVARELANNANEKQRVEDALKIINLPEIK